MYRIEFNFVFFLSPLECWFQNHCKSKKHRKRMGNIMLMHRGNIYITETRCLQMKFKTCSSHNHFHLGERRKKWNQLRCDGNEDLQKNDNNEKT